MVSPAPKVIILTTPSPKTDTGLTVVEDKKNKSHVGTVYAIGAGKCPIQLKKGDKIVYDQYMGSDMVVEGKSYVFVYFKDVLAKL